MQYVIFVCIKYFAKYSRRRHTRTLLPLSTFYTKHTDYSTHTHLSHLVLSRLLVCYLIPPIEHEINSVVYNSFRDPHSLRVLNQINISFLNSKEVVLFNWCSVLSNISNSSGFKTFGIKAIINRTFLLH